MNKPLLFVFVAVVILIPFPPQTVGGIYFPPTREILCRYESVCLHEIGHAIDHQSGWVSRTQAWKDALIIYIAVQTSLPPTTDTMRMNIITYAYNGYDPQRWFGVNPMVEIYAEIFMWAQGNKENVPPSLQGFYDWELAEKLIEERPHEPNR